MDGDEGGGAGSEGLGIVGAKWTRHGGGGLREGSPVGSSAGS